MDSRIENVLLFIAKNFRNELVLDDLSYKSRLSKFHFHRLFKKETGLTPFNYVNKLKLEHSVHFLIMYPNCKQLEVAFESGYSSPSIFARAFKQYYGMSPIAFRKVKLPVKRGVKEEIKDRFQLEISYFKKQTINVYSSNLIEDNLSKLYEKLIRKINKPTYSTGFYIDIPFHKTQEESRYYAGLEGEGINNKQNCYILEEGFYAHFNVQGYFKEVNKNIRDFKELIIDPSPYEISSFNTPTLRE